MDTTKTPAHRSATNWFEIAVADMGRARRFYEATLGTTLKAEPVQSAVEMAIFPYMAPGQGGALVRRAGSVPGGSGVLVYLNANGQLDACIERAAKAGGAVVTPRTEIGENGAFALIRDTEGNVVGLHSEA